MIVRYSAVFCTDPACHHSRRPHPIRASVTVYGLGTIDPGSAGPTECPTCGADIDTEPLFSTDDIITEDEA